jgi:hypothetical protein
MSTSPAAPTLSSLPSPPFRADVIVGVKCMFGWYWLSDRCQKENIPFLVGHALYMKAIHGAKAKNDKIDANKIARLLKGGNFPLAYVYPKGMRETRDLLRRRNFFVRQRSGLFTHLQILNSQYNLPPFPSCASQSRYTPSPPRSSFQACSGMACPPCGSIVTSTAAGSVRTGRVAGSRKVRLAHPVHQRFAHLGDGLLDAVQWRVAEAE